MFAFLKGKVVDKEKGCVILDVNGLGFRLLVPLRDILKLELGKDYTFWIHTYIGEKEINLYGFLEQRELEMFKVINSIPKVGPQVALSILSHLSLEEFREAVESGDYEKLKGIPRVGEKKAKRIINELKEQFPEGSIVSDKENNVIAALISLGYTRIEAIKTLEKVENKDEMSEEELLKACLKSIGANK